MGFFQNVSAQLIKAFFYFQHLLLKPKKDICRLNLTLHIPQNYSLKSKLAEDLVSIILNKKKDHGRITTSMVLGCEKNAQSVVLLKTLDICSKNQCCVAFG
jgi:hypothetical protein